jgi:hypothetical protein
LYYRSNLLSYFIVEERKDARLQKQADFINQFCEGDIWANVVIVVKQPGSFNISQAGQGAMEAARVHATEPARVQLLGFTYLASLDHLPPLASFLQTGRGIFLNAEFDKDTGVKVL